MIIVSERDERGPAPAPASPGPIPPPPVTAPTGPIGGPGTVIIKGGKD